VIYLGPLAQSVEQRTFNPWVVGSIPTGPTRVSKGEYLKVFVDIGSHFGETLVEVLKPKYGFEKILCVEPSQLALSKLRKFRDSRIQIYGWGAWDREGSAVLYSAGAVGGSVYSDKPRYGKRQEIISLRDIKELLDAHLNINDYVYMKINAEGSEFVILNRILKEPSVNWRIQSILLSLDLVKIPSLRHHEKEILQLIENSEVKIATRKDPDPARAVRIWLKGEGAHTNYLNVNAFAKYLIAVPIYFHLRLVLKSFVPKKLWLKFAQKLGPNRVRN
jgi:FkbM family methyltransferase